MRLFRRRGCLIVIVIVGVLAFAIAVSPPRPRTTTQVGVVPTEIASLPASVTPVPAHTQIPPTLDEAGRAILATQEWFTNQQTQAAGGGAVQFVPTDTPPLVINPTQPRAPAQATIQLISAQGDTAQVLGSYTFPAGLYRARVTTAGFFIAELQITQGECGTGNFTLSPSLFNLMRGQANGAEAILRSNGCTTFIELSNITDAWRLEISQIS